MAHAALLVSCPAGFVVLWGVRPAAFGSWAGGGGFLVHALGWRSVYLGRLPLVLLALGLGRRLSGGREPGASTPPVTAGLTRVGKPGRGDLADPRTFAAANVVVLCRPDGNLSETEWAEVTRELALLQGEVDAPPVAVISDGENLDQIVRTIKLGVKGYIPTTTSVDIALQALQLVQAGGVYIPAECLFPLLASIKVEEPVEPVDLVLLWWRDGDGDLFDGLVYALTDLTSSGYIWLMTPKVGRDGYVDATDLAESAVTAGLALTTSASVSSDWAATKLVRPKSSRR